MDSEEPVGVRRLPSGFPRRVFPVRPVEFSQDKPRGSGAFELGSSCSQIQVDGPVIVCICAQFT